MVDWGASLFALVPLFLIVGSVGYFGYRKVRTAEHRQGADSELIELRERVERLEDAFSNLTGEVQRVADAEQFTSRLLRERGAAERPAS